MVGWSDSWTIGLLGSWTGEVPGWAGVCFMLLHLHSLPFALSTSPVIRRPSGAYIRSVGWSVEVTVVD